MIGLHRSSLMLSAPTNMPISYLLEREIGRIYSTMPLASWRLGTVMGAGRAKVQVGQKVITGLTRSMLWWVYVTPSIFSSRVKSH